jgi:uncharacterized protein
MGMDWHSSGITTSVIGALKRGLAPLRDELGIHVCGGRGKHSRRTPDELLSGFRTAADKRLVVTAPRQLEAAAKRHRDAVAFGYVAGRWMPAA